MAEIERLTRLVDHGYTTVSNLIVRDKRVSLKSKGFFLTVMSLPPEWDFSVEGMTSVVKEGRDSIYAFIQELMGYGYALRYTVRDTHGRISQWRYCFGDPKLIADKLVLLREKTEVENLFPASPLPALPDVAFPTQLNTQGIKQATSFDADADPQANGRPQAYVRVGTEYIGKSDDFFADLAPDPNPTVTENLVLINVEPKERHKKVEVPEFAFNRMYMLCYLAETVEEIKGLGTAQRGRVAKALGQLRDGDADFNRFHDFEMWWKVFWMSKSRDTHLYIPPRPEQVVEYWLVAMKAQNSEPPKSTTPSKPVAKGPTLADVEQAFRAKGRNDD
jgi:hypothetical protein